MNANEVQHGGSHYKKQKIQVWDFITENQIPYLEGNAIKYLSRWRDKGGLEDLLKARHYVDKIIENEQKRLSGEVVLFSSKAVSPFDAALEKASKRAAAEVDRQIMQDGHGFGHVEEES